MNRERLSRADMELQVEVEQLLYYEARLLEEGRFDEWLDLFTEDATYRMPVRETVLQNRRSRSNQVVVEGELAFDLMNEDKTMLAVRVARLDTGLAHVETPESITPRFITNIEVEQMEGQDDFLARSNFFVAQLRNERSLDNFMGKREDLLRRESGQLKIARREVILAQAILPRPVSILF